MYDDFTVKYIHLSIFLSFTWSLSQGLGHHGWVANTSQNTIKRCRKFRDANHPTAHVGLGEETDAKPWSMGQNMQAPHLPGRDVNQTPNRGGVKLGAGWWCIN